MQTLQQEAMGNSLSVTVMSVGLCSWSNAITCRYVKYEGEKSPFLPRGIHFMKNRQLIRQSKYQIKYRFNCCHVITFWD